MLEITVGGPHTPCPHISCPWRMQARSKYYYFVQIIYSVLHTIRCSAMHTRWIYLRTIISACYLMIVMFNGVLMLQRYIYLFTVQYSCIKYTKICNKRDIRNTFTCSNRTKKYIEENPLLMSIQYLLFIFL